MREGKCPAVAGEAGVRSAASDFVFIRQSVSRSIDSD